MQTTIDVISPHALALGLALDRAHEEGFHVLPDALRLCATSGVLALMRHADAMARGATRDERLDAEAAQVIRVAVRVVGAASAALLIVDGDAAEEITVALEDLEIAMAGYERASLLVGPAVWAELRAAELHPEQGGAWWCDAYAEALASPGN